MKRVIKLKESDLTNIVKQLISEQSGSSCPQRNAAGYCRIKMSPCGNNIDPQTGNLYQQGQGSAHSAAGAHNGIWTGTAKLLKFGGQSPQVGMYFENPSAQNYCNQGVGVNSDGSCNTTWKVEHVCTGPSSNSGSCADMNHWTGAPWPERDWNSGTCTTTTSSGCDTTTASPCAVQWWQNPNATWASTWITNRDCSNYNWPSINLETQALALMASAPNPQPGPYNNWSDIWGSANAAWPNTTGPPKNTFIGKMAKAKYSQCQMAACNC